MEDDASVISQHIQVTNTNTRREAVLTRYSIAKLHTCIISLIGVLGLCLQLKFPNVSPYAMVYGSQRMDVFIIVTCIYILSLVMMAILADGSNTDLEDLMIKVTILLGSLSLISELLVLISPFGMVLLFLWCICLVWFVSDSYQSLKTLFRNSVGYLVQKIGELKQKLVDFIHRLMESNAIAAVSRASQKLKDLIRTEGKVTEHAAHNKKQTNEVPV